MDVVEFSSPWLGCALALRGLYEPLSPVLMSLRASGLNAEAQAFGVGETAVCEFGVAMKNSELIEQEMEENLGYKLQHCHNNNCAVMAWGLAELKIWRSAAAVAWLSILAWYYLLRHTGGLQ
jgi:hypothetical protein